MPKKKQSHAQDNIYVVRQFAYVHGVAEILLLSRKKIQVQQYSVSVSQENDNNKTLITKSCIFYILCTGFTMGYKTTQHYSSRVINRIKHN